MTVRADAGSDNSAPVKLDRLVVQDSQLGTAALVPVQVPAEAVQPQSTLGTNFIDLALLPSTDYTEIANFAPSVANVPAGLPGSQESITTSIRGFQDGQYNVTFDGIPFGDTNDFTHHSNNYFTPDMLQAVIVDRGPGTADTVGEATFGGTVGLSSRALSDVGGVRFAQSFGDYNTRQTTLGLSTGRMASFGNARAAFGYNHSETDGYQIDAGTRRSDYFFKFDRQVGTHTRLTAVVTASELLIHPTAGLTLAQIAQFGPRYGLNNDPTSQAYQGYNYVPKRTDFEYIGLQTNLGGVRLEDKAYSYYYYNKTRVGADLSGETPNGTTIGGPGNNDVPGQVQPFNQYRAWGNILRVEGDTPAGVWKTGLWSEYTRNRRYGHNVDFTLGEAFDELPSTPGASLNYDMTNTIATVQPYAEFAWKPLPGVTVTPGVKYISFRRAIAAPVNQKTQLPIDYRKTYTDTTPSLAVNDRIDRDWSVYAQVARGFLGPNLNLFYVNDPGASRVSPQQTVNYQTGVGYAHGPLSLAADGYYIDFNNEIGHRKIGNNTVFFNQGGTTYQGLEAEGSLAVGGGFNLYVNGSVNRATDKATGQAVPESPESTAAAGLLYRGAGFTGSLVTKYVGRKFGDTGETIPIGSYTVSTASVGYAFEHPFAGVQELKVKVSADNVFDTTRIDDLAGYTPVSNTPMYWTVPGRSYLVTFSVAL